MKDVATDINYLAKSYFYFDEPVVYSLRDESKIKIFPISVRNSEIFLSSVGILNIDKNSMPDPKLIQMSYLQFICDYFLNKEPQYRQSIYNILFLCLGMKSPTIEYTDENIPMIYDLETKIKISPKDFDEIKRIILYQNLLHYDDEYINPELKQAIQEADAARSSAYVTPNLERQIAIISAHTGITKQEQMTMTMRSHTLLFEEVCGEVEYTTIRPVALFTGSGDKCENWIFKNHKGKFDEYIQNVDDYTKSIGAGSAIKTIDGTGDGDSLMALYNNFN